VKVSGASDAATCVCPDRWSGGGGPALCQCLSVEGTDGAGGQRGSCDAKLSASDAAEPSQRKLRRVHSISGAPAACAASRQRATAAPAPVSLRPFLRVPTTTKRFAALSGTRLPSADDLPRAGTLRTTIFPAVERPPTYTFCSPTRRVWQCVEDASAQRFVPDMGEFAESARRARLDRRAGVVDSDSDLSEKEDADRGWGTTVCRQGRGEWQSLLGCALSCACLAKARQ